MDWVNIELPVLSVHGNHDNPHGEFSASAIDLLVTMGLLSHFGRIRDQNQVAIYPVSLKKGKTLIIFKGTSTWHNLVLGSPKVVETDEQHEQTEIRKLPYITDLCGTPLHLCNSVQKTKLTT